MESWLTEALGDSGGTAQVLGSAGAGELTLLPDPAQLQLDFSVPLQLLYDQVSAFRCRICQSLHLSEAAVTGHIEERHCQPEDLPLASPTPPPPPPLPPPPPPPLPPPALLDLPLQSDDKEMFLCSDCGHVSETLRECKSHMRRTHLAQRRRERDANATAATKQPEAAAAAEPAKKKRERRPPQKLRHDKRFMCRVDKCSQRFTREQHRNVHEKCHVDCKSYKCCQCAEFATSNWCRVMTHMWRQHALDLDMFACDKCDFRSALLNNLENHRLLHMSECRFVCPECNKGFRQMSQLLNHRVLHRDRSRLPVPKWCRPHVCTTCSKMFSSVKTLKIHQRILHDKVRSFCCRVCSHTSATKALLQLHMRGHSGETPFVCTAPDCDYRTRDPSSFRRHKMRHTGVRPYRCPHCDYQCIQSSAIKWHVIGNHGGSGVFSCHLCTFCTVNEITYAMHISDHQKGLISSAAEEKDESADSRLLGTPAEPAAAPAAEPADAAHQPVRHEYVFTITPDAPAEDRGGISIPAGQEDCHMVNGFISPAAHQSDAHQ